MSQCTSWYAHFLLRTGHSQEALKTLEFALKRDPIQPPWYWEIRGMALLLLRRYEEVIQAFTRKSSHASWDHGYLAVAYAHLGRGEDARKEAALAVRLQPNFSITGWARTDPYRNPADLESILDGLRKAGLPE